MIYKIIKTSPAQAEGEDNKTIELEINDLIPFNGQSSDFKDLFNSINQNNIAEFDNADVILFPESGRVIISKKQENEI